MQTVAVVATLKNEIGNIGPFLDALLAQTRPPDRIILVDGGSTDGTIEAINARRQSGAPVDLIVERGANRSRGRNLGISQAKADLIAMTDCGAFPDPDWLAKIVAPFAEKEPPDVVAGFYRPLAEEPFARAVAAVTVPTLAEVDPTTFLPSSRSAAFTRDAWERAGGYPEHLSWNEDTAFDLALKAAGCRFRFAPEAVVRWRVQGNVAGLLRQFFRYAIGDAQARLWFGHYTKVFVQLAALAAVLTLAGRDRWWWLIFLAALYAIWTGRKALRRGAGSAILLTPLAMATVDLAHVCGYVVGLLRPVRPAKGRP
jgi:cellulose synthase/poly-beta-1,6-N-acetylglucosamine synthase-like glycosyltransferase